jgi:hypothetical protein
MVHKLIRAEFPTEIRNVVAAPHSHSGTQEPLPDGHTSRIRIPESEYRRSAGQDDAGDAKTLADAYHEERKYAMRDKTTH